MDFQYLYYLAVISVSYVGFTAFFITLRQLIGADVDQVTAWLTRYLIAVALCVAMTALMPPLLNHFVTPVCALRLASAVTFVLMFRLDIIFILRLPHVYKKPTDAWFWAMFGVAIIADILFILCTLGIPKGIELGEFSVGETIEVGVMFCYFSKSLEQLLPFNWETSRTESSPSAAVPHEDRPVQDKVRVDQVSGP
jgi:hypothetical protein